MGTSPYLPFLRVGEEKVQKRVTKVAGGGGLQSFCSLNLEVTSHHVCYIIVTRSKSINSVQVEGIIQKCKYRRKNLLNVILEAIYNTSLTGKMKNNEN